MPHTTCGLSEATLYQIPTSVDPAFAQGFGEGIRFCMQASATLVCGAASLFTLMNITNMPAPPKDKPVRSAPVAIIDRRMGDALHRANILV
jgi:hypothetical protein